jgi:hypothetical protein
MPLLVILILLQVLDVATTNLVPHLESNPVVLFLFNHLGALWWLPKAGICLAIAAGFMLTPRVPMRSLVTVTAGYTVVVSINMANVVSVYLT